MGEDLEEAFARLSREEKLQLKIGMIDGTFASAKKGGAWLVSRREAKEQS